jgi:hypothetical protein
MHLPNFHTQVLASDNLDEAAAEASATSSLGRLLRLVHFTDSLINANKLGNHLQRRFRYAIAHELGAFVDAAAAFGNVPRKLT